MDNKDLYKCEYPNHNNNINDSIILNYCYDCKKIICLKCLNYLCINKHKVDSLENAFKKAKEELNGKAFMTNRKITNMKLKNGEEFVNKKIKSFVEMCNKLSILYKNKFNEYSKNYVELKNQQNRLKENIEENPLVLINLYKNNNENINKIKKMYDDLILKTKFINYIHHKTANLLINNSIYYNERFTISFISSETQKQCSPKENKENKLNEKNKKILDLNNNENELKNDSQIEKQSQYSNKNHLFVCLNNKTKRNEEKSSSIDNIFESQTYKKPKIQNPIPENTINSNNIINNDKKSFECNVQPVQKNKEPNEKNNKIINININRNTNFLNNNKIANIKCIFGLQNIPLKLVVFSLKPNSFSEIEYIEEKNYIFQKCDILSHFPYKNSCLLNINNNEAIIVGGEDINNNGSPGNKFCYKINFITDIINKGKIICTKMESTIYEHQSHSLLYSKLHKTIFALSGSKQRGCEFSKINDNGEINKWEPLLLLKGPRENCLSFLFNEQYIFLVGGNGNQSININYDKLDISTLYEKRAISWDSLDISINDINKNLFEFNELGVFIHNNNLFVLGGCNLNDENENRIKAWKISFGEFSRYKLFDNIESINLSYFEKNKSELPFLKNSFINTKNDYCFLTCDGICKRIPKTMLKI